MKAGDNPIRTVITGVGVVSPIGIGNDAFWKSLIEGRSGIGYLTPSRVASFPPSWRLKSTILSRTTWLAAKSCSRSCRETFSSESSRPLSR